MTKRPFYTLKAEDVGARTIRAFGRVWPVVDIMGRVLEIDIGKRAYLNLSGFVQVENGDQRDKREHNEAHARYFVTRDGERVAGRDGGPHESYLHAIGALHRVFGAGSAHHAMTYEGFAIQRIDTSTTEGNN